MGAGRVRRGLRRAAFHLWGRRRLAGEAEIRVLLVDGWTDGADALSAMTEGGAGKVGRVRYGFTHQRQPHYVLVLTKPGAQPLYRPEPRGRLWYAIGEPPLPELASLLRQVPAGARVYAVPDFAAEASPGVEFRAAPAPLRTWHVKRSYDELQAMPLPDDKPLALSWITSDLAKLAGHRRRLAFLERLRGEVAFDLYGRGFRPLDDKWEGLAPYRYSIAFENSVFDGYFSEKLADPIMAGCLPLYHGCPDLERWLPPGSFLRFDPDDPLVFDRIREWVASDLWRERRPALEEAKALLLERYNTFRFLAGEFEADFPARFGRRR